MHVQVLRITPALVHLINFWTQLTFSKNNLIQIRGIVPDTVARSRSEAWEITYISSLSSNVLECSNLTGLISPSAFSLVAVEVADESL